MESVTRHYKVPEERQHRGKGISRGFTKEAAAEVVFEGQKTFPQEEVEASEKESCPR